MAELTRTALKLFFETGDKPTEAQFADLIDSLFTLIDNNTFTKVIISNVPIVGDGTGGKVLKKDNAVIQLGEFGLDDTTISSDDGGFAAGGTMFNANNECSLYFAGLLGFTVANLGSVMNHNSEGAIIVGDPSPFAVTPLIIVKSDRTTFKNLQTFADNAAALLGGLAIDDMYHTATGEVRIVV